MAMIADAFVSRLCEMLLTYAKEEAAKILGVPDEIKKLHRKLERMQDVLVDAENRRFDNQSINRWLNELRDLMYDADDIIDECRIEGEKLLSSNSSSSRYAESDLNPGTAVRKKKSLRPDDMQSNSFGLSASINEKFSLRKS
ncbi:probable disease resistance RPP8-like protein 2 isoform X3 [Phoenix dactylifera]|uniref:Probable disease resistance RPP8-like protein 2 isoform X3 n=1 Tax=Phoenix dactylifera TaxID=42345 RepID=A0A8B9A0J0_PHODC|nr:probable disease resistance RPP8-like protein 2 isoform X3 [Phoenix dactylifera]